MLDALARIAEPELSLKWPAKQGPMPRLEAWFPRDPGMGM
jgi:hypothetical protein